MISTQEFSNTNRRTLNNFTYVGEIKEISDMAGLCACGFLVLGSNFLHKSAEVQ